jgi:hypothetical protein
MDNSFQTSFIPKRPVGAGSDVKSNRPQTSILTVLSFTILIIVGGLSIGLFLYKNYLTNQKEVLSASLEKVRNSFDKDTIDELELYDKRVSAAKKVLNNHVVLSPMFALLGNLTIPSIQYTRFDHQTNANGFLVKMSGVAVDYKSIALQADVFNSAKGRFFKNVIFSNLIKDKNNNIGFDIEFNVDPALLSYQKNMILEQVGAKTEADKASGTIPEGSTDNVTPSDQKATVPTTTKDQPIDVPVDGGAGSSPSSGAGVNQTQ